MASSSSAPEPSPSDVLPWLKALPVAPEYRPTLAEFQDPISYILKIEPEASRYGICKIIPPLPPPPKKTAVANLNRSFAARDPHPKKPPTFSTRHQRVGFCPRSPRPALRHVWQSSDHYTLQQFEAKAKQFEKSQLKKAGKKGTATPIEIETLFWKASADRPFSVEYANDMPGSGFAPTAGAGTGRRWRRAEDAADVGETAWNMRGVSRAKGSLLRFMREDIPGVTSPMVYVAMMFSWFAWHVEDHDLHSLNYLDLGASKTWYGVPRDAALAFEEVVRVHGYNGEVNPLATFAILREKTTVMSPEVLIGAGIPCCRLVQNAGEFVVTFPGAYHSGFSHGFNCGEAANIATPEWLRVAKEAAIRRASTNYPPMVSHFQLLYALALSLCSRVPMSCNIEPRSSRLKDKMKGEGEIIVKKKFVENVIENNNLLSVLLDKGSSCIILPQNTSESLCSSSHVRSQVKVKPRLSFDLCSRQEALEGSKILLSDNVILDGDVDTRHSYDFCSMEGNAALVCQEKKPYLAMCGKFGTYDFFSSTLESQNVETEKERTLQGEGILDQGLLSCVTCGILSFACVAVIQPREAAARYLMSTDCSLFNDNIVGSTEINNTGNIKNWKTSHYDPAFGSGPIKMHPEDRVDDNLAHCSGHSVQVSDRSVEVVSGIATQGRISALDLLASAYGDSSDSEETEPQHEISVDTDENDSRDSSLSGTVSGQLRFTRDAENFCSSKPPPEPTEDLNGTDCQDEGTLTFMKNSSEFVSGSGVTSQDSDDLLGLTSGNDEERCRLKSEFSVGKQAESPRIVVADTGEDDREIITSSSILKSMREHESDVSFRLLDSDCCATGIGNACLSDLKGGNLRSSLVDCSMRFDSCSDSAAQTENASMTMQLRDSSTKANGITLADMQRSDKDSSRMHVFCLEHAVEVEKRLHPMGDVHVMLLCHPDYPKIEAEATMVAQELGFDYTWKDIPFKEATKEDQERIRSALEDEEAIPTNSDWTVKLGINLYYSASLSKSPLYSKQMPYNTIIYRAFGCNSPANSPIKLKATGRRPARHKKIVVAGRWCGKVWMSNQVHPFLAHRNEAQERDDSEKLYSHVSDKNPKVESDIEHTDRPKSVTIKATRKSNRKRKMPSRKVNNKKPRCSQVDSSPRGKEDVAENSIQSGRVLRSCRLKHATTPLRKLNQKDEAEGGPSTRLRSRPSKFEVVKVRPTFEKKIRKSKAKKALASSLLPNGDELLYPCDVEGCPMGFSTKHDLALHKRNICPVKGCGKKFFSHKYLVQHRKVHLDDRPLKCPWKGCKMTFKWAWARTEHIRVHTGDRPYVCHECSQTFRFVSDFSRHKRKTGHSTKKGRR